MLLNRINESFLFQHRKMMEKGSEDHNLEAQVVLIKAERCPMPGKNNLGPHQIYRNPKIGIETRKMDRIHPYDIRVEMKYGGVCGTDVHMVQTNPETGYVLSSAPANIPSEGRVIGHEGIGRIIAKGSCVHHLNLGSYVTFESIIVCHHCGACRKGQFNQCYNAKLLGLETDGLFGTVVDVPALLAHDVTKLMNDDNDLMAMACVEPAAVAYVGCINGRISPGDTVVIFGAGPIGLYAAMLSKRVFGASMVHVIEPVRFRRRIAREWCDEVYDIEEFFDDGPQLIDAVIEASGQLENIQRVLSLMAANARVVLLARSGDSLVIKDIDHLITNAVTIKGSRGHLGGAISAILKLYNSRILPLERLITRVVSGVDGLSEFLGAPEIILHENCKVLVKFSP